MKEPETPTTWSERIQAAKTVPPLLGMMYRTHRGLMVLTLLFRLVQALTPITMLWIGKLIIEVVELYYRGDQATDWRWVGVLIGIEFGVVFLSEVTSRASRLVEGLLGERFRNEVSIRLMEHAATLDIEQFEDANTYDQLERARQHTHKGVTYFMQLIGMLQNLVTVTSLVAGLVVFVPWLPVLLAISVLPAFFGETHFAALDYELRHRWTQNRRLLAYLRHISANDIAAKEIRLFGLSPWLIERYREGAEGFVDVAHRLAVRRNTVAAVLAAVGSLGLYMAYAVVIYYTITGRVGPDGQTFTIGTLTFLMGSLRQSRSLLQSMLLAMSSVYEQSLYIRDLFSFLNIRPSIVSVPNARPIPRPIRKGFVFKDVGYRYPGSDAWAVRHLSFTLRAEESVALVGKNGAGKTTLVKLISRLYDPTEGRILLDGVDLREYDINDLHRAIGVIFQDFQRLNFTFRENIGVGLVEEIEDEIRIAEAAKKSRAHSVARTLEQGFGQPLGRRFDGGVELSGGEWQKVALGRAYMRDAPVLILDEPTAALDARAEYEVFERFTELTHGRMAVLISHRFSTVRMADRILVLERGEMIESGSHAELVEADGAYAELFHLQAEGYR